MERIKTLTIPLLFALLASCSIRSSKMDGYRKNMLDSMPNGVKSTTDSTTKLTLLQSKEVSQRRENNLSHYGTKYNIKSSRTFSTSFIKWDGQDLATLEILTERLVIRPVWKEDYNNYFEYLYNDPKTMKLYGTGITRNRDYVKKRVENLAQRWKNQELFSSLVILDKYSLNFIGQIMLDKIKGEPTKAEVSYLLRQTAWGRQIASEALTAVILLCNNIFQNPPYDLKEIIATCREDNIGSWKVLLKCGFQKYGKIKKYDDSPRYLYGLKLPSRNFSSTSKL